MEYLLHGNVTDKAVSYVCPKNLIAKAYTFRKSRMLPPSMPLQSIIVRMVRCKLYVPDVAWIAGASGPYNFPRAEALWCATTAPCYRHVTSNVAPLMRRGVAGASSTRHWTRRSTTLASSSTAATLWACGAMTTWTPLWACLLFSGALTWRAPWPTSRRAWQPPRSSASAACRSSNQR